MGIRHSSHIRSVPIPIKIPTGIPTLYPRQPCQFLSIFVRNSDLSSSGGVVIRYVFPVLRMTSYLDILACNKRRREVVRYIETGSSAVAWFWQSGTYSKGSTGRQPRNGSGSVRLSCWYNDADQVPYKMWCFGQLGKTPGHWQLRHGFRTFKRGRVFSDIQDWLRAFPGTVCRYFWAYPCLLFICSLTF